MAESSMNNFRTTSQFNQNSNYKYGNNYRFKHVRPKNRVCRFYQKGNCKFGRSCWNLHVEPSDNQPARQTHPEHIITDIPTLCEEYAEKGFCAAGHECEKMHGNPCPDCHRPCLHPLDASQRSRHAATCQLESQQRRLDAQKVQEDQRRGVGKTCGICLDEVCTKTDPTTRKFGVLESCDHIFCFGCIMKWREVKARSSDDFYLLGEGDSRLTCPVCRAPSEFVAPSRFWVTSAAEKSRLIKERKAYLRTLHCKAFRRGRGHCPRGSLCYFLHVLQNGRKVRLPPPPPPLPRPPTTHDEMDFMSRLFLMDFHESHDELYDSESDFEDELDELDLMFHLNFDMHSDAFELYFNMGE